VLRVARNCTVDDVRRAYRPAAAGTVIFKRCASDSERERHCARFLCKFRENT